MASRFHIEDLVSQDSSGVVFRAVDQESGHPVAIRRFFPFGPEGGGLEGEEKVAFDISIHRLTHATHPALRTVVTGGCDPIDSMPFVVTEWIEGEPLSTKAGAIPMASRQSVEVIMRALEVSEVLSQLLAEEAVWVETDIATIIDSTEKANRGVTFWISPLKWLGNNDDRRSLKPIVQLTEDLMGWKNKLVNDQAGGGLASWLKWLKQHAKTTTLAEARATLAAATGGNPPPPTSNLVRSSTRPVTARASVPTQPAAKKKTKKKSAMPLVLSIVAGLCVLAGAGVYLKRDQIPFLSKSGKPGEVDIPPEKLTTADVIAAADAARAKMLAETEEKPATPTPAKPAAAVSSADTTTVYQVNETDKLLKLKDQTVSVEGSLVSVNVNDDKSQVFLNFEQNPGRFACGFFINGRSGGDMTETSIKTLIGKKIRMRGKVGVGSTSAGSRPKIQLSNRASITVL